MPTTPFPAVGHIYEVNFGSWVNHLHFLSETAMLLTNAGGAFEGNTTLFEISVIPIRSGVFLISWQEEDKTTLVDVGDFENGTVHAYVTGPHGCFLRRCGTLKKLL